jgi:1-aminocyclopropane-1-carboxylate deaminase/D-cysteine desulfhydrase-like pyridoxal-dependent ACC family enzyme
VLGGPRIFIKHEDLSGLALGGNKCRRLEFILAEAKRQGADVVISTAGSQSNYCVQVAAAARRLKMKPSFVLVRGIHNEPQGNLLLQDILGSDIEILELTDIMEVLVKGGPVSQKMDRMAEDLRANGYNPFIIRHDIPDPSAILSPVGWVNAADELTTQLRDRNIEAGYVVVANSGGVTQAGLVLGLKYLGTNYEVIGISNLRKKDAAAVAVAEHINALSDLLGLKVKVTPDELEINDSYIGEGYGIPDRKCIDAMRLAAQTEGIFLDPVYTGKAMAGLIDLIDKGRFKPTDTIVFVHTGGVPALFAYHKEMVR